MHEMLIHVHLIQKSLLYLLHTSTLYANIYVHCISDEGSLLCNYSNKPEEVDLHPEKRLKAAYKKFEETNMPIIKQENPNMKLSQLKQMLWKDWQKSPENPLNQRLAAS